MLKTNQTCVHSIELMIFRKWTNKPYAVFNSMKKLIKISVLSVSCSLLTIGSASAFAQVDSLRIDKKLELDEIEILTAVEPLVYNQQARIVSLISKREISRSVKPDFASVLSNQRAVDIRQRGGFGVQSDLSIRGSSFDQVLVLLNGIPLSDAQTGHFNLNLPFAREAIQRIEILKGSAARVYGANAFAGAVNIVTQASDKKQIMLLAEGGQNAYYNLGLSANYSSGRSRTFVSYQKTGSDGYMLNTEFQLQNFFLQSHWIGNNYNVDLQLGAHHKDFGANGFYSAKYPLQYEHNKAYNGNANINFGKQLISRIGLFWRRHQDQWILTKENPSVYQNFHQTDSYGLKTNHRFLSKLGKTHIGSEIRSESIWSTSLGESQDELKPVPWDKSYNFSHYFNRENASLFIDHQIGLGTKYFAAFGFLTNWNSDYSSDIKVYPGLDLSYSITPSFKLISSVNQAMRLPTFTDLYYAGPANIGNVDLVPEKATSYEFGLAYSTSRISFDAVYFSRIGKNIIDWVWIENLEKWQTQNILDQTIGGIETGIIYKSLSEKSFVQKLYLNYTYLDANIKDRQQLTKYASTHLKNQLNLGVYLNILPKINLNASLAYRDRVGVFQSFNFENNVFVEELYNDVLLLDITAQYKHDNFTVFIDGVNLLSQKYFEYGIMQDGLWIKAGIAINIEAK